MARKPKKKTQKRGLRIAQALFVGIGLLVVLSMVLTSVLTFNPQPPAPPTLAIPTITLTP